MKKYWMVLVMVLVGTFTILGFFGSEIYKEAPPIYSEISDQSGNIIYTEKDILDGQVVWQSIGGQQVGSIWGHGAYQAPDWTADWLHRELVFYQELYSQKTWNKPYTETTSVEKAIVKSVLVSDYRESGLKDNKVALSETEKAALESFEKMNILAFRADSTDISGYDKEIKEVKAILKDESYQQLMKAGSGNDGAAIYFVGNDDEHIEEFVVLAGKKENGFAVVRVLGNDMNPTHIMNMLSLLQKSQVDMEQLKPLQQLMK